MLGEGATTRQAAAALYLSPKTVEYHLRHVYMKLGDATPGPRSPTCCSSPRRRPRCRSEAMRTVVLAALLALIAATPAAAGYRAAPGRVTFALPPEHPYIPSIEAVAALPGGASIVAGTSGRRAFVARLRADGGLDRRYGRSGVAHPDGIFVAGIAVAGDGSVTVVMDARAGASPPPRLVRLDPGGKVDRGYGDGGKLDLTRLNGEGPVAATPDGGVVVAGSRDDDKGSAAVRVTPAGAIDTGFGGGLAPIENGAAALAVQPDGRVLVAGERPGDEDTALHSAPDAARRRGRAGPVVPGRAPAHHRGRPRVRSRGPRIGGRHEREDRARRGRARAARRRRRPDVLRLRAGPPGDPVALFPLAGGALVAGTDRDASVRLARLGADGAGVAASGTRVGLGGGSVDDHRLGGGFYTLAGGVLRPDGERAAGGVGGPHGAGRRGGRRRRHLHPARADRAAAAGRARARLRARDARAARAGPRDRLGCGARALERARAGAGDACGGAAARWRAGTSSSGGPGGTRRPGCARAGA